MLHRVYSSQGSQFELVVNSVPLIVIILLSPLILFSLWGTLFTFISGASSAYSITSNLTKSSHSLSKIILKRVLSALVLLLIANIDTIFFAPRTLTHPIITHSIFTGSLELGKFTSPELLHYFTNTTLESIAVTNLLISAILFCVNWKKHRPRLAFYVFLSLGLIILIGTALTRQFLPDPDLTKSLMVAEHNYLLYFFYIRFFAARFALFPVFAFGCFGAAIGVLLAMKVQYQRILKFGLLFAGTFISIFILYYLNGFNVVAGFPIEIVPLAFQFLNLGLQILFLTVFLRIFDYRKSPISKKAHKRIKVVQRYSNLSLTIYILEKFLSQLWYMFFEMLNQGPFSNNLPVMLLYFQIVMISWWIITKIWAKYHNKFSFEWIIQKLQKLAYNGLKKVYLSHKSRKKISIFKIPRIYYMIEEN